MCLHVLSHQSLEEGERAMVQVVFGPQEVNAWWESYYPAPMLILRNYCKCGPVGIEVSARHSCIVEDSVSYPHSEEVSQDFKEP